MDMSKIKLIYPEEFKKAVRDAFPENNVLVTALKEDKYSVGIHLENEIEKVRVTSDEIISSIELGVPSKASIMEREQRRKKVEGLYIQWMTIMEEQVDEYEEKERERVSSASSSE